jgi:hypothetical protein
MKICVPQTQNAPPVVLDHSSYFVSYSIPSINNMPAMLAEVKVDKTPQKKAEIETLTTSPERLGEICESTPIWIPSEPMLPKPCSACVRNDKFKLGRLTE